MPFCVLGCMEIIPTILKGSNALLILPQGSKLEGVLKQAQDDQTVWESVECE